MRNLNGSHYGRGSSPSPRSRLVLGFVDQGIVSATGLIIFVAAAQFLSADDLGYFSFSVATCLLVVSLSRAICGESLLVRTVGRSVSRPTVSKDCRSMLGLAVALGVISGCVFAGIGMVGATPNWPLVAAAFACPGLVLQDSVRFVFIARQRTTALLVNDAATLILGTTAIMVAGSLTGDIFAMVTSWGLASLVISLATLIVQAIVPSLTNAVSWLKTTWKSSSAFFTESALGALVGYLIIVILTIFVDPSEVAALRATLVVYGVASLVINFLRTQVLRELRLDMINNVRGVGVTSGKLAAPVIMTIVVMLLILLFTPEWLGHVLMGESWVLIASLFIPGALNRMLAGFSTIPTIILRVQGIAWRATLIKVCVLISSLVIGPLAALHAGAAGALYADAFAYGLSSLFLFVLSVRKAKTMAS